jgi:hypothetical protein
MYDDKRRVVLERKKQAKWVLAAAAAARAAHARPLKSELNRELATIGLPPQGGGVKGQSRPTTAQENVAILTVVCVLMYNCCMQRLCSRRILSCDRNPLL